MIKKELFPDFVTDEDFKKVEKWIKNLDDLKRDESHELLDFSIDYNHPIELVMYLSGGTESRRFESIHGSFSVDGPVTKEKRYDIVEWLYS